MFLEAKRCVYSIFSDYNAHYTVLKQTTIWTFLNHFNIQIILF